MWEYPVLSEKEKKILVFIKDYMEQNHSAPSLQEICDDYGNKSPSTIHKTLEQLEKKGYIERNKHHTRSLILTDRALEFLGENPSYTLPVYATVRGGPEGEYNFNDDFQQAKEYLEVPLSIIEDGRFAVKVIGDSMDAFVRDGDYAVIDRKQDSSSHHNRIVIVQLNKEEAYIKRLIERSNGKIVLRSENPDNEDIFVQEDDELEIIGEVIQIIRHCQT